MLGLKLNHVSKRGHWSPGATRLVILLNLVSSRASDPTMHGIMMLKSLNKLNFLKQIIWKVVALYV